MEKHIHNINNDKIKDIEINDEEIIMDLSVLFKMFLGTIPESLNHRAATKNYFKEIN